MPYCAHDHGANDHGNGVAAGARMAGTAAGLGTAGRLDALSGLARSPG
jgi:hypothetical protein